MKEIWKEIEGYEGLYWISNSGRVKSRTIFLKQYSDRGGYLYVALSLSGIQKKYKVHRLVAIAFISNPKNKIQVNHKSGVKCDNHVFNLEWNTPSENQNHAYKNGLKFGKKGSSNPSWIAKINQYDLGGNLIKTWESLRAIMRSTGFDKSAIAKHIRGNKNYSHAYGFKWEFV